MNVQRITDEIATIEVWKERTNTSYRGAQVLIPASYQFIGYLDGLLVGTLYHARVLVMISLTKAMDSPYM